MGEWDQSLCGCFGNFGVCMITFLCPCITFGQIAEKMGKSCCLYGCLYLFPIINFILQVQQRGQIREQHQIDGSCAGDCCVAWCVPLCGLCQAKNQVDMLRS